MALEQQAQASTSQSAMDVEMPIGDRWKQVDNVNSVQEIETAEDALESDEEWEEETTTTYVTFDFGMSGLTHDAFKEVSFMQLVGFNSSTPIVKIGAKIFRGQHERLIGTDVIYTEHDSEHAPLIIRSPLALIALLLLSQTRLRDAALSRHSPCPSTTSPCDPSTL